MGIDIGHIRIIRTVDLEEDYIDGLRDMLASRTTWGDDAPISRDIQEQLMANAKERHDKLVEGLRDDDQDFLRAAMVQTMYRDFNRLREAIRGHDSFATEAAWEKCERWISQLEVKSEYKK